MWGNDAGKISHSQDQNIKIVDSSVCSNSYTLIRNINMWYETNILKIHTKGMVVFKERSCRYVQAIQNDNCEKTYPITFF